MSGPPGFPANLHLYAETQRWNLFLKFCDRKEAWETSRRSGGFGSFPCGIYIPCKISDKKESWHATCTRAVTFSNILATFILLQNTFYRDLFDAVVSDIYIFTCSSSGWSRQKAGILITNVLGKNNCYEQLWANEKVSGQWLVCQLSCTILLWMVLL